MLHRISKYLTAVCCVALCVLFPLNGEALTEGRTAPEAVTPAKPAEPDASRSSDAFQRIAWEDLIPADWKPEGALDGLNLDEMEDNDPRAEQALARFMEAWEKAPANAAMDGRRIRLAGFVAPLEFDESNRVKEFLLVPYFGACIHVPPPPANQIIHVTVQHPVKDVDTMTAVWIYGTLRVFGGKTDLGFAGYALTAEKLEPYDWNQGDL